jgi:uncharacterized protein YjbI with pentapeptide repeats
MADAEQLRILKEGVEAWNQWRVQNAGLHLDPNKLHVDLSRADLRNAKLRKANLGRTNLGEAELIGADLRGANISGSNLRRVDFRKANLGQADLSGSDVHGANLREAKLRKANLRKASLAWADLSHTDLTGADFTGAELDGTNLSWTDLSGANLSGLHLIGADFRVTRLNRADLTKADLRDADFSQADLTGADLSGADLRSAILVRTNLERANLTGSRVYGVSTWNLNLANSIQKNIIITPEGEPTIQVDRLDIAQFLYLLLNNAEIRHVIDTITSKVVLILGRFTDERKAVLDALRAALRERDYLPILFDWEKPSNRDITETVSTLAHMARFVIADITDAKSIPQELMAIVPNLPSVPVQPLLLSSQHEYGMFEHFRRYQWVLPVAFYESQDELLQSLQSKVIEPAEAKVKELRPPSASSAGSA